LHFDKPETAFQTIVIRKVSCATATLISPSVGEVGRACVIDDSDTVEFDVILGSLLHHEVVKALESHALGNVIVLVLGKVPGVEVSVCIPGESGKGGVFTLPEICIGRESEIAQHIGVFRGACIYVVISGKEDGVCGGNVRPDIVPYLPHLVNTSASVFMNSFMIRLGMKVDDRNVMVGVVSETDPSHGEPFFGKRVRSDGFFPLYESVVRNMVIFVHQKHQAIVFPGVVPVAVTAQFYGVLIPHFAVKPVWNMRKDIFAGLFFKNFLQRHDIEGVESVLRGSLFVEGLLRHHEGAFFVIIVCVPNVVMHEYVGRGTKPPVTEVRVEKAHVLGENIKSGHILRFAV